jgi:hypothetical protein
VQDQKWFSGTYPLFPLPSTQRVILSSRKASSAFCFRRKWLTRMTQPRPANKLMLQLIRRRDTAADNSQLLLFVLRGSASAWLIYTLHPTNIYHFCHSTLHHELHSREDGLDARTRSTRNYEPSLGMLCHNTHLHLECGAPECSCRWCFDFDNQLAQNTVYGGDNRGPRDDGYDCL